MRQLKSTRSDFARYSLPCFFPSKMAFCYFLSAEPEILEFNVSLLSLTFMYRLLAERKPPPPPQKKQQTARRIIQRRPKPAVARFRGQKIACEENSDKIFAKFLTKSRSYFRLTGKSDNQTVGHAKFLRFIISS